MLPLHTRAKVSGTLPRQILKVLRLAEALATAVPRDQVAVHLPSGGPEVDAAALQELGFAAVLRPDGGAAVAGAELPEIHPLAQRDVVGTGDVVRVRQDNSQVAVLYRRGANANTLFLTEQCNSRCLMCSQPE